LQDLQSRLHGSVDKRTGVSVVANLIMGVAFNGGYLTAFLWSAYGLAKGTVTFGAMTAYIQLVGEDSASPARPDAAASHPYYREGSR